MPVGSKGFPFIFSETTKDYQAVTIQGQVTYVLDTTLKPYRDINWQTLMALCGGNDPKTQVALGFRMLAENAEKIGTLNISPDLLESLIADKGERSRR
jgi:hypothetical protein